MPTSGSRSSSRSRARSGNAAQFGRGLIEQGRDFAANPRLAAGTVQEAARKGMGFANEVARLALMGRDSDTRFKGALGKASAWPGPSPCPSRK